MSEYVRIVNRVVTLCADKWENKGDSNWLTNMFMDYQNNYISISTFIELEIQPMIQARHIQDEIEIETVAKNLIYLFSSIDHLQPMLPYERVGEIGMNILKGAC